MYSLESIKDSTQNFCKLDCMLFSFEMSVRELFSIFLVLDTKFFIVLFENCAREARTIFETIYEKSIAHNLAIVYCFIKFILSFLSL